MGLRTASAWRWFGMGDSKGVHGGAQAGHIAQGQADKILLSRPLLASCAKVAPAIFCRCYAALRNGGRAVPAFTTLKPSHTAAALRTGRGRPSACAKGTGGRSGKPQRRRVLDTELSAKDWPSLNLSAANGPLPPLRWHLRVWRVADSVALRLSAEVP